ncbi:MAG: hypothetical protein KBS52_07175 [Clostridiales bacterium]|nr:hypothetical protein [Candidatus Equinaster intestinalis]
MDFEAFPKYFLGANSAYGFINEFKNCYNATLGDTAYIIKGGPGTGKSTLMKKVAEKAYESGEKCIICPCSSDPASLDAVILPERKAVVLDGTPPHTVEPRYPALCEQIINTGAFWDKDAVNLQRNRLLELFALHKAYHKKASQYIAAAGQMARYNFSAELACTDIEKAFSFGASLAEHTIPKTEKKGREVVRFLSGITPDGYIFYGDTIGKECKTQIVISDRFGAVSSIVLSAIRDIAIERGQNVITVKSFLLPDEIIEHILIPELSLAFCTENENMPNSSRTRRIHAKRFYDTDELNSSRQRMMFNRKVAAELLDCAAETLSTAKALHDKIEKYYVSALDIPALKQYTDETVEKIMQKSE